MKQTARFQTSSVHAIFLSRIKFRDQFSSVPYHSVGRIQLVPSPILRSLQLGRQCALNNEHGIFPYYCRSFDITKFVEIGRIIMYPNLVSKPCL